jgi:hypothetical protein
MFYKHDAIHSQRSLLLLSSTIMEAFDLRADMSRSKADALSHRFYWRARIAKLRARGKMCVHRSNFVSGLVSVFLTHLLPIRDPRSADERPALADRPFSHGSVLNVSK